MKGQQDKDQVLLCCSTEWENVSDITGQTVTVYRFAADIIHLTKVVAVLCLLHEEGLLEQRAAGDRKRLVYRLTPEGRAERDRLIQASPEMPRRQGGFAPAGAHA